jgi:neutral trehalase
MQAAEKGTPGVLDEQAPDGEFTSSTKACPGIAIITSPTWPPKHESGWDMTSRFHNRCLDYLPVDLNCALYKYETDLAEYYKITRQVRKYNHYILQSERRRRTMNTLMWNFRKGFYFDYDYRHGRQSAFYSIAGFYPCGRAWLPIHRRKK